MAGARQLWWQDDGFKGRFVDHLQVEIEAVSKTLRG
jgi:hypothetical protein